eukprot:6426845-Pyramimonas_sp.AAC.1
MEGILLFSWLTTASSSPAIPSPASPTTDTGIPPSCVPHEMLSYELLSVLPFRGATDGARPKAGGAGAAVWRGGAKMPNRADLFWVTRGIDLHKEVFFRGQIN